MRFFTSFVVLLLSALSFAADKPEYCAAIRGNGELVPAHWSAMSRIVEELGMPSATAGGSSASVTMFFLESIAQNEVVNNISDPIQKRKAQALLLKTLPVYMATLSKLEKFDSALTFVNQLKKEDSTLSQGLIAATEASENFETIKKALLEYGPLLNPEILKNFQGNFDVTRSETMQAISVFGSFNAKTDDNLFFRPGLIDFKQFSIVLGKIGDFYAGNMNPQILAQMDQFLDSCSKDAYQKIWPDTQHKACQEQFSSIVAQYVMATKQNPSLGTQIFKPIGQTIPSFPTTSIVTGNSLKKYNNTKDSYNRFNQNVDYKNFSIDFKDLRFGYWGPSQEVLKNVQENLKSQQPHDLKSQKFLSLGKGTWFDALATSPAEPGLANFQKIPSTSLAQVSAEIQKPFDQRWSGLNYKKDIISAGGWSDLHPTLVLKAHGCDNVVYVTRTDGETIFGQQVFIRLMGLQKDIPFWETLKENNKEGWDVRGTSAENTPWDNLYNIDNPKSSFNKSIAASDAVYCTDWNSFDVIKGESLPLIIDAYTAPVVVKDDADSSLQINPNSFGATGFVPGCRIQ